MERKHIRSLLREAAETEAPPDEIELWPAVRAQLKLASKQGKTMNRMPIRSLRLAVSGLSLIALLAALTLFTPQGRALAQGIYHFFVPAQATSFPLPSQVTEPSARIGTTAAPLAVLDMRAAVAEAEAAVGFDIREFAVDLPGFTFSRVDVVAGAGIVHTVYTAIGGELILAQSVGDFPSSPWSEVPAEAIEVTSVAGFYAEFAQGNFVVYPNAASVTWESDGPVFRLRWSDGQFLYSLEKMGDTYPIEWLDKQAMIRLAEGLMANP